MCCGAWEKEEAWKRGGRQESGFEVQHTDWYSISCMAQTRETGTNEIWHLWGGLMPGKKTKLPPQLNIFACTSDSPLLFACHHFLFTFSCSSLQNTSKCIFYQSAEQLWAGCGLSGERREYYSAQPTCCQEPSDKPRLPQAWVLPLFQQQHGPPLASVLGTLVHPAPLENITRLLP